MENLLGGLLAYVFFSVKVVGVIWLVMGFSLLLSVSNLSSFLFFFELVAISLIFFVSIHSDLRMSSSLLYLYSVGVLSFLLMLWSIVVGEEVLLMFSLFLKLSFFPFIWWFPYMSDQLNLFCFFLIGLLSKIFPLVLVFVNNFMSMSSVVMMVILTAALSLLKMSMKQNKMKVFLAWSSKMNFSFILVIMCVSWMCGILYLFLYMWMVIYFLLFLGSQMKYWDQFSFSSGMLGVGLLVCLCAFSGLPPFLGFFCKFILLSSYGEFSEGLISLFIFFFFFLIITMQSFIYMKMMFKLKLLKNFYMYDLNFFYFFGFLGFVVGMVVWVVF